MLVIVKTPEKTLFTTNEHSGNYFEDWERAKQVLEKILQKRNEVIKVVIVRGDELLGKIILPRLQGDGWLVRELHCLPRTL